LYYGEENIKLEELFAKFEARIDTKIDILSAEIATFSADLRADMATFSSDLRAELATIQEVVRADMSLVRADMATYRADLRVDIANTVHADMAEVKDKIEMNSKLFLDLDDFLSNPYHDISETSASRDASLRSTFVVDFGISNPTCALTGIQTDVVLAHISPRSTNRRIRDKLGIQDPSDLNSHRNLIFLCKSVKLAFDRLQISFYTTMKVPLREAMIMKIWDDSIREVSIFDGSSLKFADIENAELNLDTFGSKITKYNPYRRAFAFQYYRA
jgi:hypothetical protein